MWHWGWGPPGVALFGLVWLVLWVAIIWFVVSLLRSDHPRPPAQHRTTALELLEERYARGAISREEFMERRAVLSGHHPGGRQDPGMPPPPGPPVPGE
jgi:putative membrane protein